MCSGQEASSYCEEVASIVALSGSVVDAKSLTDSASGRVFVTQMHTRERDLSPSSQHAIACSDLSKSGHLLIICETEGSLVIKEICYEPQT